MAVYAISNEKFQEMYLKHDDPLKPWPWPEEAAILTSFFLNPIDLDSTSIERTQSCRPRSLTNSSRSR